MNDVKENSSLPLLLAMTGAVVAVAVGGWFFLEQETVTETAPVSPLNTDFGVTDTPVAEAADEQTSAPDEEPESVTALNGPEELDLEVELRKARLAAGADMLIFPEEGSALQAYGNLVEAHPNNEIAAAEFEAVLTRIGQQTTQHLQAERYGDAFAMAQVVSQYRPDHPLVVETQTLLADQADSLVNQAIAATQNGDDEAAEEFMVLAQALPGRNSDYFAAIQGSMAEIREVREAAELDRQERAQMIAEDARAAWNQSVRDAIAAGNLIAPVGASAVDLIAEGDQWPVDRQELTVELSEVVETNIYSSIAAGEPDTAEQLLLGVQDSLPDEEQIEALRTAVADALAAREANVVKKVSDLSPRTVTPPSYPVRAKRRNITGWVEVHFVVTPEGNTDMIEVSQSDPEKVFDSAAIEAVQAWTFDPVEFQGRLISQRAATRLVFDLYDE